MARHFIAQMIDHTILHANATQKDIQQVCLEAKRYHFAAVCTHSFWTAHAASLLEDSPVRVAAVAGFPFGAQPFEVKLEEVGHCIRAGAHEVDVVLNVGSFLSGDESYIRQELAAITGLCRERSPVVSVKAILETAYLSPTQIDRMVYLAAEAGISFVKTSTGFAPRGASLEDIETMRTAIARHCKSPHALQIKASGGIRTLAEVTQFLEAGATRIGTSAGMSIMRELTAEETPAHTAGV